MDSANKLSSQFHGLTPVERAILCIIVVCGNCQTKDGIRASLRILNLQEEGKFLTLQQVSKTLTNLVRAELLDSDYGVRCEDQRFIYEQALLMAPKELWLQIIDLLMTRIDLRSLDIVFIKLQLALYLIDERMFILLVSDLTFSNKFQVLSELISKMIYTNELNIQAVSQFPLAIKINLYSAAIDSTVGLSNHYDWFLDLIDVVIVEYKTSKHGVLLHLLVTFALQTFCIEVKGRKQKLNLIEIKEMPKGEKACLYLLNNQVEESLELFDEMTDLDLIERLYYILALFHHNPKSSIMKIKSLLTHSKELEDHYLVDSFELAKMMWNRLFDPASKYIKKLSSDFIKFNLKSHSIFAKMLRVLFQYSVEPEKLTIHQETLLKTFDFAQNIYPGVARFYCEFLNALSQNQTKFASFLENAKNCYKISFVDFIPKEEAWVSSLKTIERIILPANTFEGSLIGKDGKPFEQKRLLWVVDARNPSNIAVLEQKKTARGGWTKGRPLALKHLYFKEEFLNYLTSYDYKAIDTISENEITTFRNYLSKEYRIHPKNTLTALIGHPNVVEKENPLQPINLVKGEVELHVREQKNTFEISIHPHLDEKQLLLEQLDPITYKIIDYRDEHVNIALSIGREEKIQVPKSEKNRIVNLLQQSVPTLQIQADVVREDLRRVEGDSTLVVCLSSIERELHLSLYVQPFGNEGPMVKPGEGRQNFVATLHDETLVAARSFDKEVGAARDLVESIEALTAYNEGNYTWIFGDPINALNVLTALEEYPHPIKKFWMKGKEWKVSKPISAKRLSLSVKGTQDWFELEGKIEVSEGKVCELKDLLSLLDSVTGRYIQISDDQFITLTQDFKKQLMELKSIAERGAKGTFGINKFGVLALGGFTDDVGSFEGNDFWKELSDKFKNAKKTDPVLPKELQAELREYQLEGFKWMSRMSHLGFGVCLADDMGLGKTIQALAIILEHAHNGPSLIVVPTSVTYNWINEIHKFTPTLHPYHFAEIRNDTNIRSLGPNDILIVSYGLLLQNEEQLCQNKWQCIIIDEAQYIKNAQAKRSKAALKLKGACKLALTGTPLENHLGELWSIFQFINPGLLGSWDSFQRRFLAPIEKSNDPSVRQALKKLIHPFILRRLKSEVLEELPPKTEQTIFIERTPEEVAFYEALRQRALESLQHQSSGNKAQRRIQILAELTKLRRAACHSTLVQPEIDIPSSKLNTFVELVKELKENKHRALVFSQFIGHLDKIKEALEESKIEYLYLDGSTPVSERQARVEAFQNGKGDLFLISLKAGGTGLNLTAADYVIHMDPWWNPAVEDQASDRAHRIGQERPVTIYRLLMSGTIEEKIYHLHNAKRTLAEDLLSGTDQSSKLSEEDLIELLNI